MENSNYYIWNDECLSIMRAMEANSIDTCITDPPYHLTSITKRFGKDGSAPAKFAKDGSFSRLSKGFMNKKWDGGDIAFQPKTWRSPVVKWSNLNTATRCPSWISSVKGRPIGST